MGIIMINILDGLNEEQHRAVIHDKGPLLILAGAGSGKTRVLTHRIAYLIDTLGVNPWSILALTFTNKAAGEMRERIDNIVGFGAQDIWVSTFHSTCVRILRRHIEAIGYERNFTIYDADDQKSLMRDVCKHINVDTKQYRERTILNKISAAKDMLISPDRYGTEASSDPNKAVYAKAYKEYQKRLFQANALDFDDLIFKTVELFRDHPDILEYYQRRFQYILVDEYQDTNTAQFELIRLMADAITPEGTRERNLCVVGDDDQSIYKFRGANIYNILNFENQYPNATVIKLEQNYRSTQNILDAANHVIKNNSMRKDKKLWSAKKEGTPISYTQFENEYEEANGITTDIFNGVNQGNASYKDFAILYRTNAQSRVFEEKLVARNIPYKIVGAVNFYQRKEIKDILTYLRTINNNKDDISVKRIINVPRRGIGLTTIDRVTNYALAHGISFYEALQSHEYIEGLSRASAKLSAFVSLIEDFKRRLSDPSYTTSQLITELLEETEYTEAVLAEEETEKAQTRLENIQELIGKAITFESESEVPPTLGEFLEEVSLVADIDNVEDTDDLVLLMTLHSAKGLEFPNVYICGMEDGVFPSYMAISGDDPEEIEEERRLCYVGITRAMERLSLSCARSRMRNGEQQFNRPSRFISEIPRFLLKQNVGERERRPMFSTGSYSAADFLKQQETLDKRTVFDKPARGKRSDSVPYRKQAGARSGSKPSAGGDPFAGNPLIHKGMPAAAGSGSLSYQKGDMVSHMRFGTGRVLEIKKTASDYEVSVDFEQAGTRKMLASFAKLKKI